jgi:diguanylate cyclase (GGDEF)-like protein
MREFRPAAIVGVLSATAAAGGAAVSWSLLATLGNRDGWQTLLPFVAVAVGAEFLRVEVYEARKQRISLSFSIAAIMAAVAAEPTAAPLISGIAAFVAVFVVLRQRKIEKLLFNLAQPILSAMAAAMVYAALRPTSSEISATYLTAALAAVLAYMVVNVGLVSVMISLHSGRRLHTVVRDSGWFAPTNVLLGVTGAFVGGAYGQLGPVVVGLFVTPVLLMRYTLAFYARRSQQTIRTLEDQATTLEQQAQRLEHQALHDTLTDLPNRALLEQRLDGLPGEDARVSLLLLDLDRFKEINDTFGHHHGDLLLCQVGARLNSALQSDQTVARLGGDEFGVILPGLGGAEAEYVALELLASLRQPFVVAGLPLDIAASIGIAVATQSGTDAVTLLRQADVAMYAAKRERLRVAVYRPDLDQYSPERLALVGALRQAIEQDQLKLVYQSQVDCTTGKVAGVEALVRWEHPEHGWIPPDQFVPLAEHTGLIGPLTRWVLERALRQCRAWLDDGRTLPTAVNLSAHDLQDPNLPSVISDLLAFTGVPGVCLMVEVTEGTLMADTTRAIEVLGRVRELGVRVSVDDFGTGYSSLAYLSHLPVDELKIDRSFLRDLPTSASNAAIVRSTIGLGHDLGLRVVAEGIENEATWDLLCQLRCDVGQGYWLGRPLAAREFTQRLLAQAAEPSERCAA